MCLIKDCSLAQVVRKVLFNSREKRSFFEAGSVPWVSQHGLYASRDRDAWCYRHGGGWQRVAGSKYGGRRGTLGYFTPETLNSYNPRRSFFSLFDCQESCREASERE
ncbi:hypothetical protein NC653_014510 [Populus alba x Populus x berolinensis]|uniref:Uncharacterized protein n=1 Tax=Populus alba x Populus x berolinensis TaxID=444605 RepID=A0AAD6QX53_9ROSI|nr:hypothetical protein NC653_014510 [Populus alba x Populus x berolinensis]